jgi:hypothetical protein
MSASQMSGHFDLEKKNFFLSIIRQQLIIIGYNVFVCFKFDLEKKNFFFLVRLIQDIKIKKVNNFFIFLFLKKKKINK